MQIMKTTSRDWMHDVELVKPSRACACAYLFRILLVYAFLFSFSSYLIAPCVCVFYSNTLTWLCEKQKQKKLKKTIQLKWIERTTISVMVVQIGRLLLRRETMSQRHVLSHWRVTRRPLLPPRSRPSRTRTCSTTWSPRVSKKWKVLKKNEMPNKRATKSVIWVQANIYIWALR